MNATTKDLIKEYTKNGVPPSEISKMLNLSYRQVRTFVTQIQRNQENKFTQSEDFLLTYLYLNGITKESLLARYIPTKAPWMIRNRLKFLQKQKMIPLPKPSIIIPIPP